MYILLDYVLNENLPLFAYIESSRQSTKKENIMRNIIWSKADYFRTYFALNFVKYHIKKQGMT